MSSCCIALGGNLGAVQETFQQALALLDRTPGIAVVDRSRVYTTAPVGTHAGDQFLNAAAHLETSCSPHELLAFLQSVETQLGRIRTRHWGPRTLDLDLLLYDDEVVTTPTLTVPHPHLWYRRFVLDPLVEMAPQFVHPIHQATIAELHSQLLARPLPCMLLGGSDGARTELQQELNHLPASLRGEVVWCDAGQHQARIVFCLQPAGIPASVSPARCINLWTFPTPPLETVRDVLTAALDSARIVEH